MQQESLQSNWAQKQSVPQLYVAQPECHHLLRERERERNSLKYRFLALIYCSCKPLVVPSVLAVFVTRTTLVVVS